MALHPDWLVPQWPAPARVRAVFSTRAGGVSQPPFDSLNLGRPSGDDAAAVDENRKRLSDAIGYPPVFMSQVHGVASVVLPPVPPSPDSAVIEADACASSTRGVVCTVRVADCLPVLLTDTGGHAVAAAHAGWRGLAQGVLECNFAQFSALVLEADATRCTADVAEHTLAWLGPCIGPQAFEVGPEVRAAFLSHDPGAERCFVPGANNKWMADLAALARRRLQALGVTRIYGNDSSQGWCTVGNPSLFFSHRRDSIVLGGSGRMAACIWLG